MLEKNKRLSREERTKLLLKCARTIFVKNGYNKANLDDIISLCGGSRRNIYEEFGSKKGLFYAVVNDFYKEITEPIVFEDKNKLTWKDHYKAYSDEFLGHLKEPSYVEFISFVIRECSNDSELYTKYIHPHIIRKRNNLVEVIANAQKEGSVRKNLTPEEIVDMAMSMIRGEFLYKILLLNQDIDFENMKFIMEKFRKLIEVKPQ